jgi:hypothetical protein
LQGKRFFISAYPAIVADIRNADAMRRAVDGHDIVRQLEISDYEGQKLLAVSVLRPSIPALYALTLPSLSILCC